MVAFQYMEYAFVHFSTVTIDKVEGELNFSYQTCLHFFQTIDSAFGSGDLVRELVFVDSLLSYKVASRVGVKPQPHIRKHIICFQDFDGTCELVFAVLWSYQP